ncbi:MAG: tRNA (adenosine(37)-N6)-threonylcarbamoyltransferase complex dimerization subunit type 1 TsaB [Ardenticatenales bacterium]|nr:tRNA (adenosine(37)-N6)-threonylcarbamoyltransferase complex dimerization subunit type 1 TsaB [Ardenticatenales bacterium]
MLLALDSATRQAGLALYDGERILAETLWQGNVHHTEWIAPALEEALRRIHVTAAELTAVGVAVGPGSFTGLRVGISLAKGLAAARNLPIIGVSTLDVTAYPHLDRDDLLCVLVQVGRGRHAYTFYRGAFPALSSPAIGDIHAVAAAIVAQPDETPVRVIGELSMDERHALAETLGAWDPLLPPALALRRPAVLAEMAWQRFQAGDVDDLHTLEPIYLQIPPPSNP